MIGAGFVAAGPACAFYRRGNAVTPLPPDTWQGMGTTSASAGGGIADMNIPNIGLANGETLFCGLICDNAVNVDSLYLDGATFAGNILSGTGPDIFGVNGVFSFFLGNNTGSDIVGTVDLNFATGSGEPTIAAMLVSRVSTLKVSSSSFDRRRSSTGTGTNQDSNTTSNTAQAKEFLWGLIGTNGFASDTLGTWQTSFTAGQRASNANGLDLKEGYRFVNAVGMYRAQVTGATNRNWRATISCYKGV